MRSLKYIFSFFQIFSLFSSLQAGEERFIPIGKISLWSESYGDKKNPALLLIMAGGAQGIMWPTEFCELLAKDFFVVRYDHRDMGLSSSTDYEKNPYDLLDLAYDAIGVLDAYKIEKAHLAGISMGGNLAMLMSVHFPNRVASIVTINTTRDLTTFLDPEKSSSSLPKPKKDYFLWKEEVNANFAKGISKSEKIELLLKGWKILTGDHFDEGLYRELVRSSLERNKNPKGGENHNKAMRASAEQLKELPILVVVPTLVIHGDQSSIFSIEHGKDLASSIPGAKLEIMQGMGHFLTPFCYERLAQFIKNQIR